MSTVEIYNPKFDEFHGRPMVTWADGKSLPRVDANLLEQYARWRSSKLPKDEPAPAFWESNGPAICRALGFCGAKALVFHYTTNHKVAYRWFARKAGTTGADWYHVCSVSAEGGANGSDTRVLVVLPTDEEIWFTFRWSVLQSWLKPKEPIVEQTAKPEGEG